MEIILNIFIGKKLNDKMFFHFIYIYIKIIFNKRIVSYEFNLFFQYKLFLKS
jgi:hypothetical protein